jgi:exosortase family protein XrtF
MLKEFKPTLLFLLKFGLIFGIGSFSYSYYINTFHTQDPPIADPFTEFIADHTFKTIKALGYTAERWNPKTEPTVGIYIEGFENQSIGVYEGCNGVNVMILFVAFIVAIGGSFKKMAWFIPAGIVAIHLFNIVRLAGLTVLATLSEGAFHFLHKYAFTAVIYAFVLVLWMIWVKKVYPTNTEDDNE